MFFDCDFGRKKQNHGPMSKKKKIGFFESRLSVQRSDTIVYILSAFLLAW